MAQLPSIDNDESWVWIGFKLGIGFALASAFLTAICAPIAFQIWLHVVEPRLRADPVVMRPAPTAEPLHIPTTRTVHEGPRPREACLAESNGVADEKFARCRNGFDYTITE